jgi:hypothetical protein
MYEDLDTANLAANTFWNLLEDLNPMMAPCNMFNWDYQETLVLEVTNSNVYLDLQTSGHIDWVYLVAPGMAVVGIRGFAKTLEDLNNFRDVCIKFNSQWGKQKAAQGAYFAERIVVSKQLLKDPAIQAATGSPSNRVFWDRNNDKNIQALLQDSKTVRVINPDEVCATLNNWHFSANREMTKKLLDTTITPFIIKTCKDNYLGDAEIAWVATNQTNTWKVKCNRVEVAHYLCTSLIDIQVQQNDQVANINFKSHLHPTASSDLKNYFTRFMIKDADDEYKSHDMTHCDQGNVADLWQAASTAGSWAGAEVVEAPSAADM